MKKIAVFGKPSGGKSTLSKRLSSATGIELFPLDLIEYQKNGEKVSPEKYSSAHKKLIESDSWIIEGLGSMESFWQRIDAADTLVYIDLPYWRHYWWATKRLLISPFKKPAGWPEGSSVLKGTLASWKFLRLSPKFWNEELFRKIEERAKSKKLVRLTSKRKMMGFLESL